jgi:phosphoribosylaminoimidazole (AIR) synthetase
MGVGMVFIVSPNNVGSAINALKDLTEVYEIGSVFHGNKKVTLI